MTEEWLPIFGYEGLYEISNLGRLRGFPRKGTCGGPIKVPTCKATGYKKIRLYKNGIGKALAIHRIVLQAFVGPCPPGMEGCHNNGNKLDNRSLNLRWDTRVNNYADARAHGTAAKGNRNGHAKLTYDIVAQARTLYSGGQSVNSLSKKYGVSLSTMYSAVRGKTWL
jgi:hypothetical protein